MDKKTVEERKSDLGGANLRGADIKRADLGGANLRDANLWGANLGGANLRDANLWGANLGDANLGGANLRDANLWGANLRGANLRGANLGDATLPNFQVIPEEGSFVAYKKCENSVVRLIVPEDAKRTSSLIGRKCRADKVIVDEIMDLNGNPTNKTVTHSRYNHHTEYVEGGYTYSDSYNDDIRVECTNGIHFFVTKQEAIDY